MLKPLVFLLTVISLGWSINLYRAGLSVSEGRVKVYKTKDGIYQIYNAQGQVYAITPTGERQFLGYRQENPVYGHKLIILRGAENGKTYARLKVNRQRFLADPDNELLRIDQSLRGYGYRVETYKLRRTPLGEYPYIKISPLPLN